MGAKRSYYHHNLLESELNTNNAQIHIYTCVICTAAECRLKQICRAEKNYSNIFKYA